MSTTSTTTTTSSEAAAQPHPMPTAGGCYRRLEDGSLERIEFTVDPHAPTAPAGGAPQED